ncbi:MAG: hypothetical protein RL095_1726 [Verrucomicrobiota bacterium]|jgi:ABC-2 type transport system permease protein
MNPLTPVVAVARREFKSLFTSSVAWVFLFAFLVCGNVFTFRFAKWLETNDASLRPFFDFHPFLYLFFLPAVGMRLWSEEEREGTLELLLTYPLSIWQAVVGKFLAGWAFLGLALLLTFPLYGTCCWLGDPDHGRILCGYLGSFLLGGMALSICGLCSALGSSQVSAYISGFLCLLLFTVLGMPQIGLQEMLADKVPKEIIDTLVFFSTPAHVETLHRGVVDFRDLLYFGGFLVFGLFGAAAVLRCRKAAHRWNTRITWIALSLGFCSLVFLNLACRQLLLRADLSSERLNTLTESSRKLVQQLDGPAVFRLYFSASEPKVPVERKAFVRRVQDQLQDFAAASKGLLKLEVIDPAEGSEAEANARLDGMEPLKLGGGISIWCGLSLSRQDRIFSIPQLDESLENQLELTLARLLQQAIEKELPEICVLTSLPIVGRKADPQRGIYQEEPAWGIIEELKKEYVLRQMPEETPWIDPERFKAVLLIHPPLMSERLYHALDQYLLNGGRIIACIDASCALRGQLGAAADGGAIPFQSDINLLSIHWGVSFDTRNIAADPALAGPFAQKDSPFILQLKEAQLSSSADPSLTGVKRLFLAYPGRFKTRPTPGLTLTPLLSTSASGRAVPFDSVGRDELAGESGSQLIGLRLKGRFPMAMKENLNPDFPHADSAKKEGEVILIGDCDFLHDSFSQSRGGGGGVPEAISDNRSFFGNLVDHAVRGGTLIELRSRKEMKRPFVRLAELNRAIIAATQDEAKALSGKITQASTEEQRLRKLREHQQQLSIPEQEKLGKLKSELERLELQRRELDSRRRQHGQAIHARLFLINLVSMPLLIALYALSSSLIHRRRIRSR